MSYRFGDSLQAGWHIALLCVQLKALDDGQRNCPKHVEFYFKNKFEKSVHLVGLVTRKTLKRAVGTVAERVKQKCQWTRSHNQQIRVRCRFCYITAPSKQLAQSLCQSLIHCVLNNWRHPACSGRCRPPPDRPVLTAIGLYSSFLVNKDFTSRL